MVIQQEVIFSMPINIFLIRVISFLALNTGIAYAYIDPGTGMLFLQGLIAFLGSLLVLIKNPIQRFKFLLKKIFKKNERS